MHEGRSNHPKLQIHGKGKFSGMPKGDQSLFSLLLEIENRLRTEGRDDQRKRFKEEDRQRSGLNNLSRYCE
jgi:hypothetical protein